jgi:hypothetical protein
MAISHHRPIPTVSHLGEDQTLVELLYDPVEHTTAFVVARPDGGTSVEASVDLPTGERLVPYDPQNTLIANGCVLLPSALGELVESAVLVREIKAFLARYVELSPLFADIAAYYVLLSWVYDAFGELPYLRFRGDYGTGKTRALMAVGALCYKPFFASGASTVSPIFHILDAFRGTLILDEADFRFSDATADLTKILNNGNSEGMPVLRTMSNRHRELNPRAFRVFGPKLIAMRGAFSDPALESRLLTEETGRQALTDGIPYHLPRAFRAEARALRNRLLAWRLAHRFSVGIDPTRAVAGVEPRLNQTALALLSLVDDPSIRASITDGLLAEHDLRLTKRAASAEGRLIAAVMSVFRQTSAGDVSVGTVASAFNELARTDFGPAISQKGIGIMLRTRLRLTPVKSHGVYVLRRTDLPQIRALAVRYGVSGEEDAQHQRAT